MGSGGLYCFWLGFIFFGALGMAGLGAVLYRFGAKRHTSERIVVRQTQPDED